MFVGKEVDENLRGSEMKEEKKKKMKEERQERKGHNILGGRRKRSLFGSINGCGWQSGL